LLTLYRSNRAELLARLLATQLRLDPPGPLEQVLVVVNTWPTSRWLGEQIALELSDPAEGAAGGVAAGLRFPFPSSRLRQLVDQLLEPAGAGSGSSGSLDPWRAQNLVWPVLELLPQLLEAPCAAPLRQWLERRAPGLKRLDDALWQLGRAIADAIDDYGLYRPAMLEAWLADQDVDAAGKPLAAPLRWQPLLLRRLATQLDRLPFGLRARQAIELLRQRTDEGIPPGLAELAASGQPLRLFGLSSLAPVQVELLQALSGCLPVDLFLLTPCRDLWQRRDAAAAMDPLGGDWLLTVPSLEARFGRLGAEFQQLLEGSGDTQLGSWREGDAFFLPASVAAAERSPTLLEQLQERLAVGDSNDQKDACVNSGAAARPETERPHRLLRDASDTSLEFHACPGRLRQLQIVRDRLLQLLAADASLQPRDILVMTPQVEAFAPLVGAVFGDSAATGVTLPWRLTDRSQQSEAGLSQGLLTLLRLGGERLTATALEGLLSCRPLLRHQGIEAGEAGALTALLQRAGFRWGLDGRARGGDPSHSLSWAIDRLTLGLVLPEQPGLAPGETAPLAMPGSLEQQTRWLTLLRQLRRSLLWLAQPRSVSDWVGGLREQLTALFGDGGERAWELQTIQAALADWRDVAGSSALLLEAPVVAKVLDERLNEASGRFGHRSGALTISALEPMRAIPHRVVVLLGLDAGVFPRQRQRPGFHLLEQQRRLGDPSPGDQDRYVLLESLLSARQHLLISWSSRDERTGEDLEASTPVRQWLDLLAAQLDGPLPLRRHAANPLERRNFRSEPPWPAASCDRRLLQARRQLEQEPVTPVRGLALRENRATSGDGAADPHPPEQAWSDLSDWIEAPQARWLEGLGLRPREWHEPIRDLEDLHLDERQRSALLRAQLDHDGLPPSEALPDWLLQQRGRGLLPPLAAGSLEVRQLDQRLESLRQCLELLGPPQQRPVHWQGLSATLQWRGQGLVQAHTGKPRSRQRLRLWLELLLAVAAGETATGAALVGRDGDQLRVLERLDAPTTAQAATVLEQLRAWRQQYRNACWPLPPDTGWAYAKGELTNPGTGKGWRDARNSWEGGFASSGERRDAVQALCFGSDLPLADLLTPAVQELALALHEPLLAVHRVVKS